MASHIIVTPGTLRYVAAYGGSSPSDQTFDVSNSGDDVVTCDVTSDQAWCTVDPAVTDVLLTGEANSTTITVSIDITGLARGVYTATITVDDPLDLADNDPQTVVVTLIVGPIISTIKPAGGGDYTTLADWYADAITLPTTWQWAECYGGGDCGIVYIQQSDFTAAPNANATEYLKIYAATGERHNGIFDTDKAKIDPNTTEGYLHIDMSYVQVDGMQFVVSNGGYPVYQDNFGSGIAMTGLLVENCLIVATGAAGGAGLFVAPTDAGIDSTFRNNIVIGVAHGIILNTGFVSTGVIKWYNNSVSGCSTANYRINVTDSGSTMDVTVKNNVGVDGAIDFDNTGDLTGVATLTADHNASSDTTGDDWGATGSLTGLTAADEFVDPTNDLRPKGNSNLIAAGIAIGSVLLDIIGVTRADPPSIGAFEEGVITGANDQGSFFLVF